MLSTQPLLIISILISIILLYAIMLFWGLGSFWFSYMMMLILMSGVLVLFTYMMSVLPNESFEFSSLLLVVGGIVFWGVQNSYKEEFLMELSISSMVIWSGILLLSMMFLVIYLLGLMVMVVWLSSLEQGAVRVC